jgi:outer membrane protein OmpA-like peptidoglycan-associated protein
MKTMKNTGLYLLAFVLISTSVFGQQTGKQKRGDRHYNSFSFMKSVETFEKKSSDTTAKEHYTVRKLADTYIMIRQPENALPLYKRAVEQENIPKEYYLRYAQTLRATGAYKESKVWMKKYKESGGEQDSRTKEFFKNADLASAIFNSEDRNTLEKLEINTTYNDFGAVVLNDSLIVFASSRDDGTAVQRLYGWDEQPLMDVFVTSFSNGSVEGTTKLEGDVNTKHHDGPVTFNVDGTKMYFSRNNYYENKKVKDSSGIMHVGIYSAELVAGKWVNVKPTNLTSSQYTVYHPSLSKDSKQLYFSSDMPGGIGGMDIYVSAVKEDGSLGVPKNLGPAINTEGNEVFPKIHHQDNTLYFSSDGHVGLGLLDVFAAVRGADGSMVNAINLAEPINSKKDDFGYYLADDGLSGFISSNRKGGVGGDDIYAFKRIPALLMKGKIVDVINNKPIKGAKVVLKSSIGEDLATFITDQDGYYEQIVSREQDFVLIGSKDKYQDMVKPFDTKGLSTQREVIVDLNLGLTPILDIEILADLNTIYFDFEKSYIRPDAAEELDKVVKLMLEEYPEMVIRLESHTDSRASADYNLKLSGRRATSTYQYLIDNGVDVSRITAYEGFGESMLLDVKTADGTKVCDGRVRCTEAEHQLNRRTEFIIIKMK